MTQLELATDRAGAASAAGAITSTDQTANAASLAARYAATLVDGQLGGFRHDRPGFPALAAPAEDRPVGQRHLGQLKGEPYGAQEGERLLECPVGRGVVIVVLGEQSPARSGYGSRPAAG